MKLPPDWNEFIGLLSSHRVRFLVIGAHALAAHGRPRATLDLDLLVAPTEPNARRLGAALADFGFPAAARAWRRLAKPDRMVTLGTPPLQIDILTSITGVSFARAWKGRHRGRFGTHDVAFLGETELRINKGATGRTKDRLDLELLNETQPRRRPRS